MPDIPCFACMRECNSCAKDGAPVNRGFTFSPGVDSYDDSAICTKQIQAVGKRCLAGNHGRQIKIAILSLASETEP